MDRQTARRGRALVTEKRSAAQRTGSVAARVVVVVLLIAVIYVAIAVATGKA